MTGARYEVQIVHPVTGKPQVWDTYPTREAAETVAATLRKRGLFAQVRVDEDQAPELPEHGGERRRFLCWAVMCGFAKPERLTERIVAEIESEAAS